MAVARRVRAAASVSAQAEYGGYDFNFTKPVPERLRCGICTKVLRDPLLTECCGQHFCESCLDHWFKKQNKTTCPHCRHVNFKHMLNKERKRDIEELEIQCTKQEVGCLWVGELSRLQMHLDSDKGCGYVEVQCSNKCGAMMKRNEREAHLAQQCPLRKIQCQYCHYEDTYQKITTQHYKECPSFPLPCPNNCGTTGIRRADMANHRSRCELERVECPFCEAGCTAQIVRREFDVHMSENQQHHLLVLLGAFQETKRKLNESERAFCESERKLHNTTIKLLETRLELEESKRNPAERKTLKKHGDEVTFHMTNFSLYKQTGMVWHSPPFYFNEGYKLCVAVYANGKGAGAGTHLSVELLQMRGEHDDKLTWWGNEFIHTIMNISIQIMEQCETAQSLNKQFSLKYHLCSYCFTQLDPHEDHRVCQSFSKSISKDKFIDHKSAEELMVFNDTIVLEIRLT